MPGIAGVDRQMDRHAAATALQRGLVGAHQVLRLFLEFHVGVADQPEHAAARARGSPETAGRRNSDHDVPAARSGSVRPSPSAAGARSARSAPGSGISAACYARPPRATARSAITRPMLGMNGNGCAGSMASGVSTGNTRSMNQASSHCRRRPVSVVGLAQLDARPRPAGRAVPATRAAARPSAVAPAPPLPPVAAPGCGRRARRAVTPALAWPISPATRTEQNSSRLLALMDTKRSRSSSGWRSFSASSSTRWLKSSQDSSRLMKRSGSAGPIAGGKGRRC